MVRVALWVAFVGTGLCPALLISDLGRPLRFLNMLRVFKWRSAMSMGSWILSAFGGAAFLALATNELILYGIQNPFLPPLRWVGEFAGALTGLLLASYTGVLIGATAIPVWHENRRLLPGHFLTSGLGGSSAILELFGFLVPATQILGFAAASIETLIGIILELRHGRVYAPLHRRKIWLDDAYRRDAGRADRASRADSLAWFGERPLCRCCVLPRRRSVQPLRVDMGWTRVGTRSAGVVSTSAQILIGICFRYLLRRPAECSKHDYGPEYLSVAAVVANS